MVLAYPVLELEKRLMVPLYYIGSTCFLIWGAK